MVMCEWGVCWRGSEWVFVGEGVIGVFVGEGVIGVLAGEGVIGVIAGEGRSEHWIIRYSLACMIRITRDTVHIPW